VIRTSRLDRPASAPVTTYTSVTGEWDYPAPAVIGTGFGTFQGACSDTLEETSVNIIDPSDCATMYDFHSLGRWFDLDITFCGAEPEGVCQDESGGGPLFDTNGALIGIFSYGNRCGVNDFPAIYTRVSEFDSFIRNSVCEYSANPPAHCPPRPAGASAGNVSGGTCSSGHSEVVDEDKGIFGWISQIFELF